MMTTSSDLSWYSVNVSLLCVPTGRQRYPKMRAVSFNMLAKNYADLHAALRDLYADDDTIVEWALLDWRRVGTAYEYRQLFGEDGLWDTSVAVN